MSNDVIVTVQLLAMRKHYDELVSNYGKVVSVSLVSDVPYSGNVWQG